jgi:hypothetical protein
MMVTSRHALKGVHVVEMDELIAGPFAPTSTWLRLTCAIRVVPASTLFS